MRSKFILVCVFLLFLALSQFYLYYYYINTLISHPKKIEPLQYDKTHTKQLTVNPNKIEDLQSDPMKLTVVNKIDSYQSDFPRTKLAIINKTPFPVQHDLPGSKLPPRTMSVCRDCYWHTLLTTTKFVPKKKDELGGTFIFTGDIDDLWLRDSAAQVHPYIPRVLEDPYFNKVLEGLIERHAFYINFDPYANAFRIDVNYKFSDVQKQLGRHDYISTWNYELDSGCYYLRLIHAYWQVVPSASVLRTPKVKEAADLLVQLWTTEQYHEDDHELPGYYNKAAKTSLYRYPGLSRGGKGRPVGYTGMTWTGFRPSDDECVYGYLIPANMFAVVTLGYLVDMATELWEDLDLAERARVLRSEIDTGIRKYGIIKHTKYGEIYAFEVDGLGNSLLMDDANVPSLMSIPYLGWEYDKQIYENTRRFILSSENPTFAKNRNGSISGYGSSHVTSIKNNIWPMAQIMQGLTTTSVEEKVDLLRQLLATDDGTGWMHESYNPYDPSIYTRPWFCWADALFAEFVMSLTKDDCPGPLPIVKGLDSD